MSDQAAREHAIRLLTTQIEKLGELRNASTRDPGFKLWRQSALTVIQRLWEGDEAPSIRFRRIPFSPPSTRADDRSTREAYERGCAEALQILRGLLGHVEANGVPRAGKRGPSQPGGPGVGDDQFPTLTLPASGGQPEVTSRSANAPPLPNPPAPSAAPPAKSAAPASLEATRPAAASLSEEGPRSSRRAEPPRAARTAPIGGKLPGRSPKNGKRHAAKPRLKDLLGFTDEPAQIEPAASAQIPPAGRPDTPVDGSAPARIEASAFPPVEDATGAQAGAPPVDRIEARADASDAISELESPPPDPESVNDRALRAALDAAIESIPEEEADRATAEFLQSSPVFRASPKPPGPRAQSSSASIASPAAIALAGIAAEAASLGVPAGNRAQVRQALLELADHLDRRELGWDGLREAVHFVMKYPAVGRRVLPLLIPYLDQAA